MPWWQNFSSSSLNRPHYDDTQLGAKQNSKSGMFTRRNSRHQITSGKKPRNLTTDNAVEQLIRSAPPSLIDYPLSRSSPAHGNPPSPQPLPLPELQLLLRPPNSNAINVPLPSPRDRTRAGDASSLDNPNGRVSSQEGRWSADPSEIRYGRGSHVLQSAPASPYSVSPIQLVQHYNAQVDHQNSNYVTPGAFQVWSAPAMVSPSTERVSLEKTSYSFDNSSSPLNSPRISPNKHAKTHIIPTSPLTNLSTWREGVSSNSQGNNVHPLPLPPMGSSLQAAPTPTPTPVPHISVIPDVVPVNSQWQKGKLIGRGTFGSVYVASNKETGALCAMKEVELLADDPKSAECIKQLEQEIKVLSNLQHPNIVQYYGSEIVGDRFYIYLEYVHPGSLTKFIKDHCGAMTEAVVRNFTRHILSGLAYLHSTKTIHRDIKGANLLVDAYGVVKLADFGMAKHLNGHRENLSLKGSPYWMAPELLQSVIQTDPTVDVALAVDIWSLGCTIIEMLSGRPPWSEYEGAAALFKVLKENPPIPENLSEEANDFLQCCFQRNPAERPTASMLLEHRFLKCSNQHDVSSNFGTRPMENPHRRERPSIKVDKVPVYLDSDVNKRIHYEATNMRGWSHHSPRSTLDDLPGISPPPLGLRLQDKSLQNLRNGYELASSIQKRP